MFNRKKKHKEEVLATSRMNKATWVLCIVFLIYGCCILYPFVLGIMGSFKTLSDYSDHMFSFTMPTLKNYKEVFTRFVYPVILKDGSGGYYDFLGLAMNSLLYAVGCAFMQTITPCIVAYCCQRFPYFFSKVIETIVYVVMIVPIIGSTASSIQMAQNLGLYDSIWGQYIMKCSFLGLYFLVYHAAFQGIPRDYEEAVYMDGGGNYTIFFRVMLPLVKKQMFTIFILQFVGFWSDYTTALYYMPSHPTLSLALLDFSSMALTTTPMQLAGCFLTSLPGLILFAKFSDRFMGSLQIGGVKG